MERITVLRRFVDQCYWERINYLSGTKDWKKFKVTFWNNSKFALNILFDNQGQKESRQTLYLKRQIWPQKWSNSFNDYWWWKMEYLAEARISTLLREVTSNQNSNYY